MMNGIRVAVTTSDEPDKIYYGTTHTDGQGRQYVLFDDDNDVYYPDSADTVRELTGPDVNAKEKNIKIEIDTKEAIQMVKELKKETDQLVQSLQKAVELANQLENVKIKTD